MAAGRRRSQQEQAAPGVLCGALGTCAGFTLIDAGDALGIPATWLTATGRRRDRGPRHPSLNQHLALVETAELVRAMKRTRRCRRSPVAGFTLLEALVATTLMGVILTALGAITAQWLPSWDRGFMRVQRSELFNVALNRLAADLSAAEFVTPNRASRLPVFEGSPSAVTLVRSAVGPNTEPGLEVVRIAESTDRQGIALVRTRTPFAPFGLGDTSTRQLTFTDPVVLLRAPFRVSFSYSSGDGSWQDTWQNMSQMPAVVRFLVRDQTTGRTLAISSATLVYVELPADCADPSSRSCSLQSTAGGGPAAAGAAARRDP